MSKAVARHTLRDIKGNRMRSVLVIATIMAAHWSTVAEAKDLDAVKAAARNHRVVLENDDVRVLQVEVAPGEVEPIHSHRWASVMHIETPQPLTDIIYREAGGKMVEVRRVEIPAAHRRSPFGFRQRRLIRL